MDKNKKRNVGSLIAGVAIGVGAGVLLAPKKGSETREDLKNKIKELSNKVKNIDSVKIKDDFNRKIKELEKDIKELDKEKVFKIAKEKSAIIKGKAESIVKLAKEKGDEVLEKTAMEVREKAIEVTKNVLDKLENNK